MGTTVSCCICLLLGMWKSSICRFHCVRFHNIAILMASTKLRADIDLLIPSKFTSKFTSKFRYQSLARDRALDERGAAPAFLPMVNMTTTTTASKTTLKATTVMTMKTISTGVKLWMKRFSWSTQRYIVSYMYAII